MHAKKSNLIKSPHAPMGVAIKRPDSYETKHRAKFLNNGSNRIAICGSSGTGKSTILLELIPCFNDVKEIVLCTSKPYDPTHTAVENYCESEGIDFNKLDNISDIIDNIERIVDEKKEKDHFLIIFDDISMNNTEGDPVRNIVTQSFRILRSFGGSLIIITQSYNQIPTKVRENLTHRFVFPLDNIYSIRTLLDDISGKFFDGNNEREVKRAIKFLYQKVYYEPWGWIMAKSNPPVIMWKWDKIIYAQQRLHEASSNRKA